MDAIGIVCEYNPFHNGHKYHIEQSLIKTDSDAVVCVMSGNFLQRGEVAILDKWKRAELALNNGADLVFEIPTCFILSDAGTYASASVFMLESFGAVKQLCFGSESGDCERLKLLAGIIKDRREEIESKIKLYTKHGYSFPAARQQVLSELEPELKAVDSKNPNDVLALEYLININRLLPVAIAREGAGYNEGISGGVYQSASGIRGAVLKDRSVESIKGFVPSDVFDAIAADVGSILKREDRIFELIRYKLLETNSDEIDSAPQGGEGLGNRLVMAARNASSLNELILMTKSKRYTYTRISRLIMQLLIGIKRDDIGSRPEYLRLLGFTKKGVALLAEQKSFDSQIPVLTNVNKERHLLSECGRAQLDIDLKAVDIFNLVNGKDIRGESDAVKKPIMI